MNEHARIISQNIKRLAFEAGKTQTDISNDLGINKSTLSCWMNGVRIPKMKNIDVLCRYFGVKRSDIMDEKRNNSISDYYPLTDEEKKMILAFRVSDETTKDIIRKILDVKKDASGSLTEVG